MNPQTQQNTPQNTNVPSDTPTTPPSPEAPIAVTPASQATPVQTFDPLDMPQPVSPVQPTVVNPQPLPNNGQATPSDHKKIKILGYSLIILTVLSVVSTIAVNFASVGASTAPQLDASWLTSVINVLIGIGILKYNKIALYAFVILNAFSMIVFIGATVIFPFFLLAWPFFLIYAAYVIWGCTVLLPRRVRALFH